MKKTLSLFLCLLFLLSACAVGAMAEENLLGAGGSRQHRQYHRGILHPDDPQQATVENIWYQYYPDCTIEWINDSGKLIARPGRDQ